MNKQMQAKIEFVKWLRDNDPFLFNVAVKRHQMLTQNVGGLGFSFSDLNFADIATTITDTVKSVAPALVQYKAQSKILKMQLDRARQGLPPADVETYTPVIKTEVSASPEMERAATRVAQESIRTGFGEFSKLMPLIIIGGLGFALLKRK